MVQTTKGDLEQIMNRYCRILAKAGVVVSLLSGATICQGQETTATAILRFKFRDSDTGQGIVPESVVVDGTVHHPGGRGSRDEMHIFLEEGDHEVTVIAEGYQKLTSRQTAVPEDEAPLNVISLDPEEIPYEFQEHVLKSYIPPGGSIIAGSVVDDVTGDPIKDAVVAMSGITTRTSERGFFILPAPLPDAQPLSQEDNANTLFARRGFSVFKPGYGPVERRNVVLIRGIPKTFRLRLIQGDTPDIEDEDDTRGNLPASSFGLPTEGGKRHDHEHNHAAEETTETK